jgi:hypothetical protein
MTTQGSVVSGETSFVLVSAVSKHGKQDKLQDFQNAFERHVWSTPCWITPYSPY